jgi:hypothetical protein
LKGCSSSKIRSPDLGKISRCFSNAPPHKLSEEEHVSNSKCWKCGKRQNCCHLFCSGCGKIQPVGGSCCNYFKLLDMYTSVPPSPIFTLLLLIESHSFHPLRPVSFKVDEKSLEQNYKNIQKVTHPDRYSMASEVFFPFSFSSNSPIPLPTTTPAFRWKRMLQQSLPQQLIKPIKSAVSGFLNFSFLFLFRLSVVQWIEQNIWYAHPLSSLSPCLPPNPPLSAFSPRYQRIERRFLF